MIYTFSKSIIYLQSNLFNSNILWITRSSNFIEVSDLRVITRSLFGI